MTEGLRMHDVDVVIPAGEVQLGGRLTVPAAAAGVVVFAHGSGSSRHSPRNRHVASVLNRAGFATLLFDLLTTDEEAERANVFDTRLLMRRLAAALEWTGTDRRLEGMPVGCFGASTGAAAALGVAGAPGSPVFAVVSRGGRPDLAPADRIAAVRAPVLLIVGGDDIQVLRLNRLTAERLTCEHRVAVIPGATHLFEEPGTLDRVAAEAADWYRAHLPAH